MNKILYLEHRKFTHRIVLSSSNINFPSIIINHSVFKICSVQYPSLFWILLGIIKTYKPIRNRIRKDQNPNRSENQDQNLNVVDV